MCWRERTLRKQKDLADLGWFDGIGVGLAQALAIIPGLALRRHDHRWVVPGHPPRSRGPLLVLALVPGDFWRGMHELYHKRHELLRSQDQIVNLIIATVVSGIIGYASIAFLLNYLKRHTTYVFVIYRILLGLALLSLLHFEIIKDHRAETPLTAN